MGDRKDSGEEQGVALGEVLRSLGEELTAPDRGRLPVESATVELDLAVENAPDGSPALVVPTGVRGKGSRTARLTVTLRSPTGRPAAPDTGRQPQVTGATRGPGGSAVDRPEQAAPDRTPDRAPGLLDLLADTLRAVAEPTAGSRSARPFPGSAPAGDDPERPTGR